MSTLIFNDDVNVVTLAAGAIDPTGNLIDLRGAADLLNIDADLEVSTVLGGSGGDFIQLTNTIQASAKINKSLINGEDGDDEVLLQYRLASSSTLLGGAGNDFLQLSSTIADQLAGTTGGRYSKFEVRGSDGIDKIYVDQTVESVRDSQFNLGTNINSTVGPIADTVFDIATGTQALTGDIFQSFLNDVQAESMLIQALNISDTAFRGNEGADGLIFGINNDLVSTETPTTFLDNSINGGSGDDAIVALRDFDTSLIQGGKDQDTIGLLSGQLRFTKINGNEASDTLLVGSVLMQNSSIFGGKDDDVFTVTDGSVANSLISGDDGADSINFVAANSNSVTLSGGTGDDEIDDLSQALTSLGTVVDGGDGDDRLRQAANIIGSDLLAYGATIDGGKGEDILTGDLVLGAFDAADAFVPNVRGDLGSYILNNKEVTDAARDLFVYNLGDTEINQFGVGRDVITDFDSDRTLYWVAEANNFLIGDADLDQGGNGERAGSNDLTSFERDQIQWVDPATGLQGNISINFTGLEAVSVNAKGQLTNGSTGATNLAQFISIADNLTTTGAALIWTGITQSVTNPQPFGDTAQPVTSFVFISDGVAGLNSDDLLIELTNVASTAETGGLVITNGRINNIV